MIRDLPHYSHHSGFLWPWLIIPLSIPSADLWAVPKLFTNFQIFYFYRWKLLRVMNGSSKHWYILQRAGQVIYNSLMSSSWALFSPWPLEAAVKTSLPLSYFQSSTIVPENLVHVYNRYQTARLSFYPSICLSTGIPQGTAGFLHAFCTKVTLVYVTLV